MNLLVRKINDTYEVTMQAGNGTDTCSYKSKEQTLMAIESIINKGCFTAYDKAMSFVDTFEEYIEDEYLD